jgi:hypothetical protein
LRERLTRKTPLIAIMLNLVVFNISSFLIPSYALPLDRQLNLSPNQTDVHNAQVFSVENTVYVFWIDLIIGNDDIYFKRSTDGGASFGDTINLSNNAGDSYNYQVNIPTNDTMYVVWQDETQGVNGTSEISFKRSTDGGASFGDTINLSNNTGDSTDPYIASSNDKNIYVVWRDDSAGTEQILFQRSSDNGASFETGLSEHLTLSNNTAKNIDAIEPQVASDKSNVYVVWSQGDFDSNLTDVFFKRSTDGGASFGDTINLSNSPNNHSTLPSMALLDENVYTAWSDGPLNKGEVNYRRSTDGGASFGDTINLSNNTGDSVRPEISISALNVFIVWQNQVTKGDDIFFKRSTDGGASFGDTINVSNKGGNSMKPEITVTNASSVFIVWQNQASNSKASDIFFKRGTDGGASFGDTLNLSNNAGDSTDPDIASSHDGRVFAVWTDDTNGKKQVFFTLVT